uniref:Uncharacterized protein n=1 Tax=Anguilla anguilla TaxID=7936 RepID=A0A0E9UHV4_ANGAN
MSANLYCFYFLSAKYESLCLFYTY